MATTKKRTLNELRQTKDTVYSNEKTHRTTAKTEYTFSKKGLVDLLQQYEDDSLNPSDFVDTIIP